MIFSKMECGTSWIPSECGTSFVPGMNLGCPELRDLRAMTSDMLEQLVFDTLYFRRSNPDAACLQLNLAAQELRVQSGDALPSIGNTGHPGFWPEIQDVPCFISRFSSGCPVFRVSACFRELLILVRSV